MKAILEFNLPEDENRFKLTLRGPEYFAALWDIKNQIRNHNKYDVSAKEVLDRIEEILYDVCLDEIE
jgi:hypothetical protein